MPEEVRLVRNRRAAREAILQALYQLEVSACTADEAIRDMFDRDAYAHEIVEFMRDAVREVAQDFKQIDARITPLLSRGWDWSRVATTDKCALRLAAWELWSAPQIPPKVTISEAVAIATKFGSEQSSSFVNGLLANLLKASPKAQWDSSQVTEVVEDEPAEEVVEPEEELVQEGTPAHEEMITAGAWVVRKSNTESGSI